MTITRTAFAVVALLGSLSATSAFAAATEDAGFSPDGVVEECVFDGEVGHYVCPTKGKILASLTGDQGGNGGNGKISISIQQVGNPGVVQAANP